MARYIRYLKNRIRLDRRTFILYTVLRALVLFCMIRQIFVRNYEGVGICLLSLLLFLAPSFMEDNLEIEIPPLFEGIIYLFIFAAEILGEVDHFYINLPGWDTMLHTINGFLCAAVGFSLIDLLNRHSKRIQLSPLYLCLVAFCFSMTVGVCWEFIECAGDLFFGQDMQKDFIVRQFQSVTLDPTHSQIPIAVKDIEKTVIYTASGKTYTISGGYLDIGILDTMKDLMVNFIGALVFSLFGYRYLKKAGRNPARYAKIAENLIVRAVDKNGKPVKTVPVEEDAPLPEEKTETENLSEQDKESGQGGKTEDKGTEKKEEQCPAPVEEEQKDRKGHLRRLDRKLVSSGHVLNFYHDVMELPDGKKEIWDFVAHRKKGGACVVPVLPDEKILLIRQFRPAIGRETLELPAGAKNSYEEDTEVTALRELEEETGYTCDQLTPLLKLQTATAWCDESTAVYLAKPVEKKGAQQLDEAEEISLESYSPEELKRRIESGEIQDSKTVAGILAYLLEQKED